MKQLIFFIPLLFGLWQCESTKTSVRPKQFSYKQRIVNDGKVFNSTLEVLPGKAVEWKKDGTGKWYPHIIDGKGTVVKIQKDMNLEKPLPDSGVAYMLYFELPEKIVSHTYKDAELKKIKAFTGFMAFHPESGYRPATKGSIRVKVNRKKQSVILDVQLKGKDAEKLNGSYTIGFETGN